MNYEVLETHIEYDNGKLSLIAVLWYDNKEKGWVRATYSTNTNNANNGYNFLMPSDKIDDKIIQRVCSAGMYLPDNLKKKYFPGKKNWSR